MSYLSLRKLKAEYDKLKAMSDEGAATCIYDDDWDQDRFHLLEKLENDLCMSFKKAIEHCDALIPEDEWEEYCQNLAEEVGCIQRDCRLIDFVNWDDWADAMRADYKQIDFDGDTYYWKA